MTASNSPSQMSVTWENSQPPTLPFAPIPTARATSIQTKTIESKSLLTSNSPSLALTANNLTSNPGSFSGPMVSQKTPVPGSTVSIDGETGSPSVSLLGSESATRIGISSVGPELPISSRSRVTASARTESHAGNQTAGQNATAPLEYSGMAAGRRSRWDIVAVMGICAVGVTMRLI
ncbi:hypothetical protein MMC22_004405 [Lobaria immixta]|nr:hypothetical protein [Lobaria immixta]